MEEAVTYPAITYALRPPSVLFTSRTRKKTSARPNPINTTDDRFVVITSFVDATTEAIISFIEDVDIFFR